MNSRALALLRFSVNELVCFWFDYNLEQFPVTLLCGRIDRIIVLLQQLKEVVRNEKKES